MKKNQRIMHWSETEREVNNGLLHSFVLKKLLSISEGFMISLRWSERFSVFEYWLSIVSV